ncbi:M16 family metallopeptidase [Candidatus Pelagibacter sp. HIMB1587]|uniref:M16 family metallopeptidase n=1 Tax=Candidatus Pelagibacter sp. HIMB1587 TaxID=3413354 RepID=UPI003F837443
MIRILFIFLILLISPVKSENIFPLDPAINYGKLENGLTYYIKENTTPENKVSMRLYVKTGSIMEEDHQKGLAHLIEHMAFNGSKNFPKKAIDEYLSSIGLNLGSHYNANASFFKTTYKFEIPTDDIKNVETAIQILADIAKNLNLTPEAFERERKIVEEEYRTDIGSGQKYYDQISKYIFKNSRLLERRPIGDIEVIRNFKYEDAISYYKKWYQPERMGLFIVGDIQSQEIKNFIQKYFGDFKNTEKTIVPDYKIPDFEENQFFTYQDALEEEIQFTIWKKDEFKKTNTIANYRHAIIGYLVSDIVYRRMQEVRELNQSAFKSAYVYDYQISDLDMYYLFSTSLRQNSINQGIEDALTFAEQVKRYGFLDSELELAKKRRIDYLKQALIEENTRTSEDFIAEYIDHFIYDEMISGLQKEIEYSENILSSITAEDLNDYFNNHFEETNRIISIRAPDFINNLPTEKDIEKIFQKVSQKQIEPYEFEINEVELIKEDLKGSKIIKRKRFPRSNIIKITLENGADIFLKKTDFKKDEIQLKAFSWGGYSTANMDKLASAKYAEDILNYADLGEISLNEKENLFQQNFVDVFPNISEGTEGVSGKSNNQNLENMFKMLYLNFTDLRVKQYHVDRFKENKINQYNIDKENPQHQSNLDYRKKLYQDHPRTMYPTDEVFNQINLEDVQNFYQDRFKDGGSFDFIIVGDFEFETIEPLIEKYIGSLSDLKRDDPYIDHGIRYTKKREYNEYKEEDAKKANIFRVYFKEYNYSYRDKTKLYLLMSILDKMLFDKVREEDNLVYSISSSKYLDNKIPEEITSFYIYYTGDPKNVDTINNRIDELIDSIKNKEFDVQIFKDQKVALKKDYDAGLKTNSFWLSSILNAVKYSQNIEKVTYLNSIVDSITLNEIARLAKQLFDDQYFVSADYLSE